jgi:hypothetical protein
MPVIGRQPSEPRPVIFLAVAAWTLPHRDERIKGLRLGQSVVVTAIVLDLRLGAEEVGDR